MDKVAFTGRSTSIQKVLHELPGIPGLEWCCLFTHLNESREINRKAEKLGIELRELSSLKTEEGQSALAKHRPDWLFNIDTTFIFSKAVLNTPNKGCLNMHPGPLPEYAGMHVNQWAIRNGEKTFGATLHWMVPEIDAGPICYREEFPILETDTGLSVFMKAMNTGTKLALRALRELSAGNPLPRIEQDLSRRRIYLIKEARDGTVDWSQSAKKIHDFVRASQYAPFKSPTYSPEAWIHDHKVLIRNARQASLPAPESSSPGTLLRLLPEGLLVAAGHGTGLEIDRVEWNGKILKGAEIAETLKLSPGDRFRCP